MKSPPRKPHLPHISWFVVFFAILSIISIIYAQIVGYSNTQKAVKFLKNFENMPVIISGTVLKDPTESEDKIGYTLTSLRLEEPATQELAGKIYISFRNLNTEQRPERSDRLTLSGELQAGFGNFVASLRSPKIERLEPGDDAFLRVRNHFADQIRTYVEAPESGLELGYLLGMKTEIDPDFEETLRMVGLTHMVVASGTHLGILVGVGRKLFGKISRFAGLLAAGIMIVIFVGITGLTPSMMRAAFVSGLTLIAWYFGRDADAWRILLYAAAVTLLINPDNLTDLAWQLSFGSFTGLMLIAPILTRFFYGSKSPGFIGSSIVTSVSTILCCAPILLYSFGSLSIISILANILILPTLAPVMGLGLVTGVCGLLGVPLLAQICGFITTIVLKYHIFTVNLLGAQSIFLVEVEKNNPIVFLLWLIPVSLIIIKIWQTKKHQTAFLANARSG